MRRIRESNKSSVDDLMRVIDGLDEDRLRQVLRFVAKSDPAIVLQGVAETAQNDDLYSMQTQKVSNTGRYSGLRQQQQQQQQQQLQHEEEGAMPDIRGLGLSRMASGGDFAISPVQRKSASLGSGLLGIKSNKKSMDSKAIPHPSPVGSRGTTRKSSRGEEDQDDASMPPPAKLIPPIPSPQPKTPSPSPSSTAVISRASPSPDGGACYLVYSADQAKLILHYSRNVVGNAIGMFKPTPPHTIKQFKFTQNYGRRDLIGNCSTGAVGRKNYYSGWCQFVRAAREMHGILTVFAKNESKSGLDVDLYGFGNQSFSQKIQEEVPIDTVEISAVACLPKHHPFYNNISIGLSKWMSDATNAGSASTFEPISASSIMRSSPSPSKPPVKTPQASPPTRIPSAPQPPLMTPEGDRISVGSVGSTGSKGGTDGGACYLTYNKVSGGNLSLHYSRTPIENALGKWVPGPSKRIQGFKFSKNQGRSELIGNCAAGVAGRKNYCSGWCQYVRTAKGMDGSVTLLEAPGGGVVGLPVDVYVYANQNSSSLDQTVPLLPGQWVDVSNVEAVACVPKHTPFFTGLKVELNKWLNEASAVGASSKF